MIIPKTPQEISIMRQGGKITARVLREVLAEVKVGRSLKELDALADQLIEKYGGKPSFKMEKGYSWATCMNVNDMVVHGIPSDYRLVNGDKLCVDLGVYYLGFNTDAAWTTRIRNEQDREASSPSANFAMSNDRVSSFLQTGEKALGEAIKQCRVGNHIGDISRAMQGVVEGAGYSCVRQLGGHGVGKKLHEDPEIPCYVRGRVENTPEIKEGMTLAVEVIYNVGESPVVYKNDDGWTIVTKDGSHSAVFEHTVAVTSKGPEILT